MSKATHVDQTHADADAMAAQNANDEASTLQTADDRREVPAHEVQQAADGTRVTRAFAMKNFVPSQDWIMQNVVSKGKGHHELVGRVYGTIYRAESREVTWQDKKIASVALYGVVQAQPKDETRNPVMVNMLFMPMAFAEQIQLALNAGAEKVEIDVDIGLEATGKTIPYEWTVTSYLEGYAERALRRIRQSRQIGRAAPAARQLTLDHDHAGSAD
jgi:hypothetical protein